MRLALFTVALLFFAVSWPTVLHASDTPAAAEIAKLSDKDVRERFIKQSAQAEKQRKTNRSFNPAIIVTGIKNTAGTIGRRLREMFAATSQLQQIKLRLRLTMPRKLRRRGPFSSINKRLLAQQKKRAPA
jgi:hypothetical protein